MKVIVAGSRSIYDIEIVMWTIIESKFDITEIVSGGAKGVDSLAVQIAKDHLIPFKIIPADWNDITNCKYPKRNKFGQLYNPQAGLIRNQKMAFYANALIAVWDGVSSGTAHMVDCMRKLNKPVYIKRV